MQELYLNVLIFLFVPGSRKQNKIESSLQKKLTIITDYIYIMYQSVRVCSRRLGSQWTIYYITLKI